MNARKRILLISPLPPPAGGIASWTEQYIKWNKKEGQDVEIVNTAVIGDRKKNINKNVNIYDEIIRTKHILEDLKEKIQVFKPNIVHLNTPCGRFGLIRDFLCANIIKKNNIKLMVHYRCNIKDQIKNASQYFFLKKIVNLADVNIVLNTPSKMYIDKMDKSIIIPNFINETFIIDNKNYNETISNVLFIGHVKETKGVNEIIEVAKHYNNIHFDIIGPIDKGIHINSPNVNLLGIKNKSEIKVYLKKADLFLFPTYTEGFSNALLEAMAYGLPIITTDVGANKDMIENEGGVTVEVGNTNQIIDAINDLQDPIKRQSMGEYNISKVKENYTIDIVMEQLNKVYSVII